MGDYVATSKVTETGFAEYSFSFYPGDLALLIISPVFCFSRKSLLIPVPSFTEQVFTTILLRAMHGPSTVVVMNTMDNNA